MVAGSLKGGRPMAEEDGMDGMRRSERAGKGMGWMDGVANKPREDDMNGQPEV